ncbi:MAG TPA: SprT family zinc-dependent metalloprotease [Vicinamibacterales bacterium]|nr:SprT family zinc-dependent metalloprotease [Vicinamibacterales bacterium]
MPAGQIALPLDPPLVFVRHRTARRYVVRVRDDGSVRVTIPRRGSRHEAEAFAVAQQAWIHKQLVRLAAERKAAGDATTPERVRELKARAATVLPTRLYELANEHGLQVRAVSVRDQRWRWGSCSPSGRICLNWRLVGMPDWVRDYVIIHELMHLKRMDHSPHFWALVERACPAYKEARQALRNLKI